MDFPHEQAVLDERVVDALVDIDPYEIPESTQVLNDLLRLTTGSDVLIPVVTEDSREDIARWLTEIESDKLREWTNEWYERGNYYFEDEFDEGTIEHAVTMGMFCNRMTYLTKHYVEYLGSTSIRMRKMVLPYLEHNATIVCRRSLKDYYSILEDYGIVDALVFDEKYPLEKRMYALSLAAAYLCINHGEYLGESGVSKLIMCASVVYAKRMYKDAKEIIDGIIMEYFFGQGGQPTKEYIREFIAKVCMYYDDVDELFERSKDTRRLALEILEEMYEV